jgi:beta-N-acetylglucosaminidase
VLDAEKYGVRLVWGLSPYRGLAFNDANYTREFNALKSKLAHMRSLGVKEFALLADDTGGTAGAGGSAQLAREHARLANDFAQLAKQANPAARTLFVGVTYSGQANVYTDTLGQTLDASIDVMWTGKAVSPVSINAADLAGVNTSLRRMITIWDNWGSGRMETRAGNLPGVISGFLSNPVASECSAGNGQTDIPSTVEIERSLGTIADYQWDSPRYMRSAATGEASNSAWLRLLPLLAP